VLVALIVLWMSWHSQRQQKSKTQAEAGLGNPTNTTKAASGAEFNIDPSSRANPWKHPMADVTAACPKGPDTSAANHTRTVVPGIDFHIGSESLAPEPRTTADPGKSAADHARTVVPRIDFRIRSESLALAPGTTAVPGRSAADHVRTVVPRIDFRIRSESLAPDYPARTNSIAGLVNCPPELRKGIAVEARRWLQGLPSPAPVSFGVLAGHTIGTESAKWTIRHRRQISEALSALGFAMEPGPEDGIDRMDDGTIVQVFQYAGDSQPRTMVVACAAAALVAGVAKAAQGSADELEEFWLSQLPSRLSLSPDQMTRLRARLAWLRTSAVSISMMSRMLGDATLEERELCAWSATVATGATGTVGKPQIAMLEAIHDALSVPRATLYTGLHAGLGAATVSADEPVTVSDEYPEVLHPIPQPPTTEDRLAQIRTETERVSAMLADIFAEKEAVSETPEHAGEGPLMGLDAEHSTLVTRLLARPEWSRADFDGAATVVGLMPDGAMEAINEWAFDKYGDPLIEDGDHVVINRELLSEDLEATPPPHAIQAQLRQIFVLGAN
jgi:hypothetical protein